MTIVGIYEGHNACAAAVDASSGCVLAAVEEERFSRIKNHDGRDSSLEGPVESARYCAGLSDGIDEVALALEEPNALQRQAVNEFMSSGLSDHPERLHCRSIRGDPVDHFDVVTYPAATQRVRIQKALRALRLAGIAVPDAAVSFVPHHLAHAAGAFLMSPVERALIVSLDGKGDGLCGFVAIGDGATIKPVAQIDYRHSLGHLYGACTVACGFTAVRHEGKVTALAASGTVNEALYQRFEDWFPFDRVTGVFRGHLNRGLELGPYPHTLFGEQIAKVGALCSGLDRADIAATVQSFAEARVMAIVAHHLRGAETANVVVAGGLFANVGINQALARSRDVSSLYVHPAMSDAGLAAGAAAYRFSRREGRRPATMRDAFLGPEFADDAAAAAFRAHGYEVSQPPDVEAHLAARLAAGEVVARFTGRAEYGPRALGNRSILAPATDPRVVSELNRRLRRSDVMPFAPLCTSAVASSLYNGLDKAAWSVRFMTVAVDCTDEMKRRAPAAVHVDGTARPQIVHEAENGELFGLLSAYSQATGIPALINTSWNLHEEPMVLTPTEAARTATSAEINVVQVGRLLCARGSAPARARRDVGDSASWGI